MGTKEGTAQLTLTVLPFNPAGVRDYEAISLSNRLHSELVKTRQIRVVEIERVEDLLKDLELLRQEAVKLYQYDADWANLLFFS